MDGNRFDTLAKSMAQGVTRRRALKGIAGAIIAGITGATVPGASQAQPSCPPGQIANRRGECRCPAGTDVCPDGCFDLKRDPNHCGSCDRTCLGGTCLRGECRCPSGLINCGGVCVDPRSDNANCGGCGTVCTPPYACGAAGQPGVCSCVPATCESLNAGCGTFEDGCGGTIQCTSCPPGQVCNGVACLTVNGGACSAGSSCASGNCVDGVCCDQACGGDGLCAGSCATGTCVYPSASTSCADPVCAGDATLTTSFCDGAGTCLSSTTSCGLFRCEDGACLEGCQSSDQCVGAAFCNEGVCQGDRPNGAECTGDDQCETGFCVGNICCDQACDGACVSCATGVCSPVSGTPCGGAGVCGGTCDNGTCAFPGSSTTCAPATCSAEAQVSTWECDGAGACNPTTEDCGRYRCQDGVCLTSCASAGDCASGSVCNGGTCEPDIQCTDDGDCQGSFCVQGVCCNTRCDGTCMTCETGTCLPVFSGPCGPEGPCQGTCDSETAGCTGPGPSDGPCVDPICVDGVATLTATCNGVGFCDPPVTVSCAPYGCDAEGIACRTSCTTDADCLAEGDYACQGGVCVQTCSGINTACATNNECCASQDLICWYTRGNPGCCRALGSACQRDSDCCEVIRGQPTYCSPEGICGGAGAYCDEMNVQDPDQLAMSCTSGQCCMTEAGTSSACCAEGEICVDIRPLPTDPIPVLRCRQPNGADCTTDAECAGGLCCEGICVQSTNDECEACGVACPDGAYCHVGRCIKPIGAICEADDECETGICRNGICCDLCGGQCGQLPPDRTPCGFIGAQYQGCCGGQCVPLRDTDNCGTCGNVCTAAGETCRFDEDINDPYPFFCECSDRPHPENPFGTCRNSAGECAVRSSGDPACVMNIDNCQFRCDSDADCASITVGVSKTDADGRIYTSSTWICVQNSFFCSAGDQGYCLPVF